MFLRVKKKKKKEREEEKRKGEKRREGGKKKIQSSVNGLNAPLKLASLQRLEQI